MAEEYVCALFDQCLSDELLKMFALKLVVLNRRPYCSTEPSPEEELEKKRPVVSEVQSEEAPAPFAAATEVPEEISIEGEEVRAITEEGK